MTAFVKGWACDPGPRGITVNAVLPGLIDTGMNPADSESARQLHEVIPHGRHGRPQEVAALVAFLAGAEAW